VISDAPKPSAAFKAMLAGMPHLSNELIEVELCPRPHTA
jgi:hypothetical protein